jgi:hypothetical protein
MDNPEKLDTQDTGRRHTKMHRKLEKMSNTYPIHSILLNSPTRYILIQSILKLVCSLFVLNNIEVL